MSLLPAPWPGAPEAGTRQVRCHHPLPERDPPPRRHETDDRIPQLALRVTGACAFEYAIIALILASVFALVPATGSFAMVARLGRLLRVLRLISAIKELRFIVGALVRSIPSVANIMMLMSIVYIYAIVGYHLFHEADPTHWRTLGVSLLSLFRVITLEDWTDIMYAAMEHHGLAWLYFVSFVVGGTFVVANLFIAVVINNLDKAKTDQLKTLAEPVSRDELLRELRSTQETLRRLEDRLSGYGEGR